MANEIERRQEARFWREYDELRGIDRTPKPEIRDCHLCGSRNSLFIDTANMQHRCNKCWEFVKVGK